LQFVRRESKLFAPPLLEVEERAGVEGADVETEFADEPAGAAWWGRVFGEEGGG
jgi:hypothetical protein